MIEKIVAREKQGNRWMYRVRWMSYEEKDDTWHLLTDLDGCKETVEEFHREKFNACMMAEGDAWKTVNFCTRICFMCLFMGFVFFMNSLKLVLCLDWEAV
jgi:hypothetical protein